MSAAGQKRTISASSIAASEHPSQEVPQLLRLQPLRTCGIKIRRVSGVAREAFHPHLTDHWNRHITPETPFWRVDLSNFRPTVANNPDESRTYQFQLFQEKGPSHFQPGVAWKGAEESLTFYVVNPDFPSHSTPYLIRDQVAFQAALETVTPRAGSRDTIDLWILDPNSDLVSPPQQTCPATLARPPIQSHLPGVQMQAEPGDRGCLEMPETSPSKRARLREGDIDPAAEGQDVVMDEPTTITESGAYVGAVDSPRPGSHGSQSRCAKAGHWPPVTPAHAPPPHSTNPPPDEVHPSDPKGVDVHQQAPRQPTTSAPRFRLTLSHSPSVHGHPDHPAPARRDRETGKGTSRLEFAERQEPASATEPSPPQPDVQNETEPTEDPLRSPQLPSPASRPQPYQMALRPSPEPRPVPHSQNHNVVEDRRRALADLEKSGMLAGSTIDCCLKLLLERDAGAILRANSTSERGHIQLKDVGWVAMGVKNQKPPAGKPHLDPSITYVVPIYIPESKHWILVTIRDTLITAFDSIKEKNRRTRVKNRVIDFVKERMPDPTSCPNFQTPSVPQQGDGTSCGLFVIRFGLHVLRGADPRSQIAHFEPERFRANLIRLLRVATQD